ncbi:flagellar protein FlgN [Sporolactobacillus sp. CPB3-1]|uniref:Flagellar protein FlgN n=1 Tax=Sporolactobacillus mangiferae TaxID=2940498 RepID=A0ABT0MCQ3_9BACL|nr:flagellar protein FlgN [Sporolactobacillus mangiferae]MCL1632654.1 flagellar protein FlgN [Sporolactobacillus mangiferae]
MTVAHMKSILKTMTEEHDALLRLADLKKEAIKNGDVQSVDRMTREETVLVDRLRRLEEERSAVIQEDLGSSHANATFTEWSQAVMDAKEREEWQTIYLALASRVYALKQANTLNQQLLHDSLIWVRLNLSLFGPKKKLGNYDNPRHEHAASPGFGGRIDSRT